MTGGASTILATATTVDASTLRFPWEWVWAVGGAGINIAWAYANAQRTRAAENLKTADANKDKAIEAKFDAVLAAVRVVKESVDGVHRRLDSHDDDIEKLRDRDNRLEVQVAKDFARIETKLDHALKQVADANQGGARG